MRYLRYLALLAILAVPAVIATTPARAQVSVGIRIGGPAYAYEALACRYGDYDYAPYACAPYGFYGPQWFNSGILIGTGPWGRGYARPYGRGLSYGDAWPALSSSREPLYRCPV